MDEKLRITDNAFQWAREKVPHTAAPSRTVGYRAVMLLRLSVTTLALVACGTETPRTTKPDAGMPAAPFDHPAPVVGSDAGSDAGGNAGNEAEGGAEAGAGEAGAADGGSPAAVPSALVEMKPFTIAIVAASPTELRLESGDGQTFTARTSGAAGTWFATKEPDLASGELARWTERPGAAEISFRKKTERTIVARLTIRLDGGAPTTKELRFVMPAGATLFVESRGAADAGTAGGR